MTDTYEPGPESLTSLLSFGTTRTRTTRTRPRDSQRSKVYAAERSVFSGGSHRPELLLTEAQLRRWLKTITTSTWWRRRHDEDRWPRHAPYLEFGDRGGSAHYQPWTRTIRLRPGSMRRWVLLHELAHHVSSNVNEAAHGWEFCAAYLALVRKWLGVEAERKLRAAFRTHGVRYTKPRTTRRTMTVAEKEAATARLAAAREARFGRRGRFALRVGERQWISDPGSRDYDYQDIMYLTGLPDGTPPQSRRLRVWTTEGGATAARDRIAKGSAVITVVELPPGR